MSVSVHAQGIKLSTQGGGVKKWQNSVHVVVECPLTIQENINFEYGNESKRMKIEAVS